MNESITRTKPRLKIGALVHALENRTYVGNLSAGIEIHSSARTALASLNGDLTCHELSSVLGIPMDEIETLVRNLDEAHLLDTEVGRISFHSRFHSRNAHRPSHDADDSNDGAYQQLQSKIASELSFTTWLNGVRDGGIGKLSERRSVSVTIYGESRIALLLFGILAASGVSQTTLQVSKRRTIKEEDTCAGYLRANDIGLPLLARVRELSRELSLFPSNQGTSKTAANHTELKNDGENTRQLAIAVGAAPADLIQEWMSQGIPHLLVENPDAASITVGPLVIPGKTPCARCISLARQDQGDIWSDIAWQRNTSPAAEVPVAVAHHISGLIALELLRFIDATNCQITESSELAGARVRFDYHAPLRGGRTLYARHPACGCTW
jgi:hypothetical protein